MHVLSKSAPAYSLFKGNLSSVVSHKPMLLISVQLLMLDACGADRS